MSDSKYFEARDTERQNPLDRRLAAQIQMGGGAIVDGDGEHVVLPAYSILHFGDDEAPDNLFRANEEDADGSDGGEAERLTIPQLKERIADLSDDELATYAEDDRKGAQEAAKAEQERRAESKGSDDGSGDQPQTPEDAVQEVMEQQQEGLNTPPEEADELREERGLATSEDDAEAADKLREKDDEDGE